MFCKKSGGSGGFGNGGSKAGKGNDSDDDFNFGSSFAPFKPLKIRTGADKAADKNAAIE